MLRLLLWVILLTFFAIASAHAQWEKPLQPPVSSADLRAPAVHPAGDGALLAAGKKEIFEYRNGNWKNLWHLPASGGEIRRVLAFKERPGELFILSRFSFFQIHLATGKSREIRAGLDRSENLLTMALLPGDPDHWFLGTTRGLMESDNSGITWFRMDALKRRPVTALLFLGENFFAAAGSVLMVSRDLSNFRPVFSVMTAGEEIEPENSEPEETAAEETILYDLIPDAKNPQRLFLASREGVFETGTAGADWRRLPAAGLRSLRVEYLVQSPSSGGLFAGTEAGVYLYHEAEARWEELFKGLEQTRVGGLTLIRQEDKEMLAVITGAGVFYHTLLPDGVQTAVSSNAALYPHLFKMLNTEPPVREVHRAVIRHARLSNAKIHRWHAGSRLAALLPSVSFDRDFSRANNIDIDRGGTSDRDQFIFGPEDVDENWGFGVGWDLGDFIWSSAQTSIDSRDKLMIELRHDLLAEATRLYFERRRLILEFANLPPANEAERTDRMLRVDELTALLDSLTGGWYGRELAKQASNPFAVETQLAAGGVDIPARGLAHDHAHAAPLEGAAEGI